MSIEFSEEITSPIISPSFAPQDAGEIGLRPKLLADYTGQEKAKGNLSVYIEAARRRGVYLWTNIFLRDLYELFIKTINLFHF